MKGAIGKGTLLETVFHVREAGYEVEKRVVESRSPLQRTTTSTAHDSYYQHLIPIPVRPVWNAKMSAAEIQAAEDADFETYLQGIYDAYPPYRLNHFEHNLHVWRQLWRVVEISDILILVADARHPQFHVPPSLYDYIVHKAKKPMVCILNKIDFISSTNLAAWIADFAVRFPLLTVVPFSSFPHEKTITNPDADVKQDKKRKAIQHEKNKAGGVKGLPPPYGIENLLRVLDEVWKKKVERDTAAAATQADAESAARAVDPNWRPSRVKNKKAAFAKQRQLASEAALAAVKSEDIMRDLKGLHLQVDVARDAAALQEEQEAEAAAKPALSAQERDALLYTQGETPNAGASPAVQPAAAPEGVLPAPIAAANEDDDEEEEEDVPAPSPSPDVTVTATAAAASSALAATPSILSKISVGLIGHPNVGKSSVINALFGKSVVSASETPGHTKHLQTLSLNERIDVVDCPGLVFAAVDMPRALQVLCGIFPISQLREPYTSVQYLANRIEIEKIYALVPPTAEGILAAQGIDTSGASAASSSASAASKSGAHKHKKGGGVGVADDEVDVFAELQIQEATQKARDYVWSAWDICEAYAKARNYSIKGSKGLYDTQRAANDILHDALSGVVLLTFSPPSRSLPLGGPASAATDAKATEPAAATPAAAQV